MSDFDRLTRTLHERAPLCERCLAFLTKVRIEEVTTSLLALRSHIALIVEYEACSECRQWTRTYSFAS